MRREVTVCRGLFLLAGLLSMASCDWGFLPVAADGTAGDTVDVIDGEGAADGDIRIDPAGDHDAADPDAADPDGADPDAAEPDESDPDGGDPDAGEPEIVEEDSVEAEPGPVCGNGAVETGEECDDSSGFCAGCVLMAPSGWVSCTDSAGHKVFLLLENWPGHTYDEYQDHCRTIVEGFSPEGYQFYGLAVFSDQSVWDCVSGSLDTGTQYFIGLFQDPAGSEPAGGWNWVGYDGSTWVNVSPVDTGMTYLGLDLNNSGGFTPPIDCGRISYVGSRWVFQDYSCPGLNLDDGICMIQF